MKRRIEVREGRSLESGLVVIVVILIALAVAGTAAYRVASSFADTVALIKEARR